VRVSVIGLNPIDHSKPCTATCNLMRRFHFSFRLRDETAELDAMVSDKLAESLFGMSAANVLRFHSHKNINSTLVDERAAILRATAEEKLQSILSSNTLLSGKLRSIRVDNIKFFMLASCPFLGRIQ